MTATPYARIFLALVFVSFATGSLKAAPPHRIVCDDQMWEISKLPQLLKSLAKKDAALPNTPSEKWKKNQYKVGQEDPSFEHDTKYTVDLENQSPIKDQCGLGTCHIYSMVSKLEQSFAERTGEKIKLSSAYIAYSFWYLRALATLKNLDNDVLIEFGAELPQTITLLTKTGLIPESAWKPKKNYQATPMAERLVAAMTNSMARATELAKTQKTKSQRDAILKTEVAEILRMIHENIGDLPTHFEFKGETYTPQSFARKFFPDVYKPWVYFQIDPNPKARALKRIKQKFSTKTYRITVEKAEDIIRERLDRSENVSIGFQHISAFVNDETGVMSLSAFKTPPAGKTLPRSIRKKYKLEHTEAHAVQIVGYDIDPDTGRVKKWKIKNSWGKEVGDRGYYHMYSDFFRAYLDDLIVPDDGISVP